MFCFLIRLVNIVTYDNIETWAIFVIESLSTSDFTFWIFYGAVVNCSSFASFFLLSTEYWISQMLFWPICVAFPFITQSKNGA